MASVNLGFKLHTAQKLVDDSKARFKFVRAGRRFGKSKYSIKYILDGAVKPFSKNWFVAPTAKQGKDIIWNDLINVLDMNGLIKARNATRMDIKLINNAEICVRGVDKENYLRGNGLDRVVMEEYAFHKPHIWEQIIRPQLADRLGCALFIGTPRGNNHFRKLEDWIKSSQDPDWGAWHFTIYDNPFIHPNEIAKIKESVSDGTWQQEFMAEYVDWVGQVYHEFNVKDMVFNPIEQYSTHNSHQCVRGIDWGLQDDTACIWVHIIDNKAIITDEYVKNNTDVGTHSKTIAYMDLPKLKRDDLTVIDKTAFRRESNGKSVAQLFLENGIRCCPSTGGIDDGLDMIKRMLQAKQILVSQRCPRIISAIAEWEYGKHEPDCLAAMRYAIQHAINRRLITVKEKPKEEKEKGNHPGAIQNFLRLPNSEPTAISWGSID